jgi:hypothetical protein
MTRSAATTIASSDRERPALRWWHICLLFVAWTLFSVFVYAKYSKLGDSMAYLTGFYDETRSARTVAVTYLAETVLAIVRSTLAAQLVFSMFAASGMIYLIGQARPRGRRLWPLMSILLIPNFGVWASVAGRESLFVGLLGFFLGAVLKYYHRPRFHLVLLALVCVAGMVFIRAPYGIGFVLFLVMFLLYRSGPRSGLSTGVQALAFVVLVSLVLMFAWPYLDRYITDEALPKAERYFTLGSPTTRTWIDIDDTSELLRSLWWSLPLALIGPTPAEALARPTMLPFLASGLVVFANLVYSVWLCFREPHGVVRRILLLGWLPAMILILFAYVPFGVYNPGSGIRYASCFMPFLVFPSLLLSAVLTHTASARAVSSPRRPMAAPVPARLRARAAGAR